MKQLFQEPDARIAALCDVNEESDYSMFYYGNTAGLKPARALVRKRYGQACPVYRDCNEMLDKEDIDAVLLATPDHSHAVISLAVIAKGKHLYCEKLEFDWKNMKVTNAPEANQFIKPDYREGWTI